MDFLQAKKLFAPPDKLDGTKMHLINMANKGFESLAMELCELAPTSKHLDEVIHELNKARLLFVHSIEHTKTGKEVPAEKVKPPKTPRKPTPPKEAEKTETTTQPVPELDPVPENNNNDDADEGDGEDEIEGFD